MATSFMRREFTATTQMLETIREELPRGASIANSIALLHIFDICGDSGCTAKDIEVLTGESAPTVSRMLKTFTEGSIIVYQQYATQGPKIIFLTEKGQALKQRVFLAKEDTTRVNQLQQEIVDYNLRQKIDRDKAAERKDIQEQYKAQGRGSKGELPIPTDVVDWADDVEHQRESARRAQIADALAYHSGSLLKAEIYKLKAGRSEYMADQLIRARRHATKHNTRGFDWRRHMVEVLSPKEGWEQKKDLQRFLIKGVWFYYNLDEDADKFLPVAIQRDFDPREFRKFIDALETDLSRAVDDSSVEFSQVMKDTREMLNTVQYNKARDILTRHVADISTDFMKMQIKSDEEVQEANHKAKVLRSFANTPQISLEERQQFQYDANAAERQAAEAREENDNLKEILKTQQDQIDKLFKLLGDKNDKES